MYSYGFLAGRFLLILSLTILCSCSNEFCDRDSSETPENAVTLATATTGTNYDPAYNSEENQLQVMKSARLSIEVDTVDTAVSKAKTIIVKLGGFVSSLSSLEDDMGGKYTSLTIRLPSPRIDEAITSLKSLGRLKEDSLLSEDVTEQYIDLEARLSNAKKLETRLVELLNNKSKSLKDILEVEKELARVREVIEATEAKKRYYDNRTSLATIELTLSEPPGLGRGVFEPLSGLFGKALSTLSASVSLLVVAIIAAAPWIAVAMFLMWFFLHFVKVWLRHKREAKARRTDN